MIVGFVSSEMSMMRPAPTLSPAPYSSISIRYGVPSIVTGSAFCGMLIVSHVRWASSVTSGNGTRACTSDTSRMWRPSRPAT